MTIGDEFDNPFDELDGLYALFDKYSAERKYEEGIAELKKTIATYEQLDNKPDKNMFIANLYSMIACYYRSLEDYDAAVEPMKKSIEYDCKDMPKDSPILFDTYCYLIEYMNDAGRFEEALEVNNFVMTIVDKMEEPELTECKLKAYTNYAYIYEGLYEHKKSLEYQEYCIKEYARLEGDHKMSRQ